MQNMHLAPVCHTLITKTISRDLNLEIIKIGRVFGPLWAFCSLGVATAVWRAYPALYKHFIQSKSNWGMAKRLANTHFIEDLALMIDILEELSILSNALQSRKITISTIKLINLLSVQ